MSTVSVKDREIAAGRLVVSGSGKFAETALAEWLAAGQCVESTFIRGRWVHRKFNAVGRAR